MSIERHYRVKEMAWLSGYSEAAIRKKLSLREIGYRKVGRIISIPESELTRLLGDLRPAMEI